MNIVYCFFFTQLTFLFVMLEFTKNGVVILAQMKDQKTTKKNQWGHGKKTVSSKTMLTVSGIHV